MNNTNITYEYALKLRESLIDRPDPVIIEEDEEDIVPDTFDDKKLELLMELEEIIRNERPEATKGKVLTPCIDRDEPRKAKFESLGKVPARYWLKTFPLPARKRFNALCPSMIVGNDPHCRLGEKCTYSHAFEDLKICVHQGKCKSVKKTNQKGYLTNNPRSKKICRQRHPGETQASLEMRLNTKYIRDVTISRDADIMGLVRELKKLGALKGTRLTIM